MTPEQYRHLQTAVAHQKAGRFSDAIKLFKRVLKHNPDNFDCVYLLATVYTQQKDLKSAIEMFRRAARIRPELLDIRYNLAVVLGMSGNHAEAVQVYKTILDINPRHGGARNNLAASLLSMGQIADALREYDKLIALDPTSPEAHSNRAMALQYHKRFEDALADFDKAISLQSNFAQAYVNRGNVLALLNRADEALDDFKRAVVLQPALADAHVNAGNIYFGRKAYDEAIGAYDRALLSTPGDSEAQGMRFYAKLHICDWTDFEAQRSKLLSHIERGLPVYPFVALAVSASREQQFRCASAFSKARYPRSGTPLWDGEIYQHDRLRIGYVSPDFRSHAVSNLAAGMFECHDRSRFEVSAISLGPDDGSAMRQRLKGAFARFIDASGLSDDGIATNIRNAEIDILIDLAGYTQGARFGIFAHRPAPIQVGYLGYSGTTGADYMDYIIADRTVIPEDHFACYSEKVVWLPDNFMVRDANGTGAERIPSRSELGLPDSGFVFCCFNQPYKITPPVFAVWMRLLQAIDGSVLWLKDNGAAVSHNLRREAEARGIGCDRLIFAPAVPRFSDHLARQRQADLFLDTVPYNAHATANDALAAGLPVLTCLGSTFAARVAASLLTAAGLAELIAASLADYEALALELARDPNLLRAAKDTLSRQRETCALFDTRRFTRNIEAAYRKMADLQRRGATPASLAISAAE